jgi:hypothetical protein
MVKMKNFEEFEKTISVNESEVSLNEKKEAVMPIETLIALLEGLKKKGKKNVQIIGTLMCQEDGNTIIASTEKQM